MSAIARPDTARSRRFVQRCALVLILAWIPGISFFGHWSELTAPLGMPVTVSHLHESEAAEHVAHCHADVSTCGDQGTGGAFALVRPAASAVVASIEVGTSPALDPAPAGTLPLPLTPPPRAA